MRLIITTTPVLAKTVQNAALYPAMSCPFWSGAPECSVTVAAITAVIASPKEFPNWATWLNTAPANDCSSAGSASDINRFDMLKKTTGTCQ